MTTKQPIDDAVALAERCEAASGPDREADLWIWANQNGKALSLIGLHWWAPVNDRQQVSVMVDGDPNSVRDFVPAYTGSIDAAMTLVPVEGWLNIHGPMTPAAFGYSREIDRVKRAGFDTLEPPYASYATGATYALALCAAALRARATS